VNEFRVPCPSGLRLRQIKDLTLRELLYAVNCLPASSNQGLYLWRPKAVRSSELDIRIFPDKKLEYIAHCRVSDAIAVLLKDKLLPTGDLRLVIVRPDPSTGTPVLLSSTTLFPFSSGMVKEVQMYQVARNLLAIALDFYGLLIVELDNDTKYSDHYIAGGFLRAKELTHKIVVTAPAGVTGIVPTYIGYDQAYIDISPPTPLPIFISTVECLGAKWLSYQSQSEDYEVFAEIRDPAGNVIATSAETYTALPGISSPSEVFVKGMPLTFSFYTSTFIKEWFDTPAYSIHLKIKNNDGTNNLQLVFATALWNKHERVYWFRYSGSTPFISIGGLPVCNFYDPVKKRINRSGKVCATGSYIVCPSQSHSVAIGDPVTLKFHTEVPLKAQVTSMEAFNQEAVISTTAETYSLTLDFKEPRIKSILPSKCKALLRTSSGIFALFKDRLFRILQGSAIEVASPLGIIDADRLAYIDDYGILLVIKNNADEMLAYSEYQGTWLYWRLDELGLPARIIEYNDGVILTERGTFNEEDLRFWKFTHIQDEDQSYEVALYLITDPIPELTKFQVQAMEIDGNLLISDENNARVIVTSLSDNQSAYSLQNIGTPWWTTPPIHSFLAGGVPSHFLGVSPVSSEPLRGQPIIFQGTQGTDISSTDYQEGVFLTGRRFIIGLYISQDEPKEPNNYVLGFRLYGRPAGQGVIGG